MPVTLGQPPPKRCKQCEDPNSSRSESTHSWSLQLDQDLLDTIAAIYPEWFKGYTESRAAMSEGPPPPTTPVPATATPTPHAEIDSSPLHTTMDKNKESLKVKLMMRRPINQLVAQGIIPSLKTPPAFHEQRQKLERAKTGDLLKAKIQKRPDRDELVRQHILEADMGHVDPSLAERQRMLKKARLADSLNDQLSHRPGPLELIQKNILHTEEPIERAVKEGVIPFKATSEGLRKPHHPDQYVTFEEDSLSSDNSQNSLPTLDPVLKPRDVLETAAASAGIVTVAVLQPLPAELCSPLSLGSSTSSLSPLSSVASPPTPLTPRPAPLASPAPGKADKNRKKSKTKAQPKAKTIKFHEYKGPPSAQKTQNSNSSNSNETSYEILLQQQQLFLQWQLQTAGVTGKYPQIILPASHKPTTEVSTLPTTTTLVVTTSPAPTPPSPPQPPPVDPPKYEDMKVSDLKEELKKRNLPVSGAKPQLIERLRGNVPSIDGTEMEGCEPVGGEEGKQTSPPPPSPATSAMDTSEPSPPPSPNIGETIIQQQQRKIEELQRELQRSQQQLMQIQRKDQSPPAPVASVVTPASIPLKAVIQNGIIHIDPKKLLLQQHVQSKMQQNTPTSNVNVKASLAARITQHQAQQQLNQLLKNKILVPVEVKSCKPPPPVYEEATKQTIKQEPVEQKNVKSQIVDDLLEILIKSGELPPSAAQDPATPTSTPSSASLVAPSPRALVTFPEPAPYPAPFIENMATDFPEVSNNNTTDHNFHSNSLEYLLNQELPTEYGNSNGNVTLKDLGLDLETLDSMDFGQLEEQCNNNSEMPIAMEMDDAWLGYMSTPQPPPSDLRLYDPLLGTAQQPYDLFNLEDNDLKLSSMSWDKVDFAT